MRQIQFTRKAIKDLQKLQSSGAAKTPERLLHKLARTEKGDNFVHTIHLSEYQNKNLWRSRIDLGGGSSLRLVWCEDINDSSIRFLYADQRGNETYEIDLSQLPQEPAYEWHGQSGAEWTLFINGTYNASPILTQQQQSTSAKVGIDSSRTAHGASSRVGCFAHITQSPPGTGKTITAAERACELYHAGWNVIFLLPQHLIEEVEGFRCMQSRDLDLHRGFFYGTFQNWVSLFSPDIAKVALSPEEELNLLKKLAKQATRSKKKLKLQNIGLRDLTLFEAFVLNKESDQHKNSVYIDNQSRIKALTHIKTEWWNQSFSDMKKQPRSSIARMLGKEWKQANTHDLSAEKVGSIVIVDEAQDYLTSEIEALRQLCERLHTESHPTHLWLLGDLNQRIMPVDFSWGALKLVKHEVVNWQCFRNSKRILQFSNRLLSPVEESAHKQSARLPQKPADPDRAYEVGEPVKLVVYPNQAMAESFLKKLSQSIGISHDAIKESRSLVHKLANRVKILTPEAYSSRDSDGLDFLNVHEAKGREFDACIAFNIFTFSGQSPASEDWWQWYTLLTRTRSRLLVIVTQTQYELLKNHVPDILLHCDLLHCDDANGDRLNEQYQSDIHSLCQWIRLESNDVSFAVAEKKVVKRYLLNALRREKPFFYWDTYQIFDKLKIKEEERTALENEMIQLIKQYPIDLIAEELNTVKQAGETVLLTSLLLRSMDQHWEAVRTIEYTKETEPTEHTRIIEAIAETFEANALYVEAARLRHQSLNRPYPAHFPFPEAAKTDENLIEALNHILSAKFQIEIG